MAHNSVSVHPESIILGQMTNVNISFMWWCQFIDWLKFETRRSFPLNFGKANTDFQSCISLLAGGYCGFHRRKPVPSLIGCHLGFLRRALPGTSGRAQKSREAGGGGKEKPSFSLFAPPAPLPRVTFLSTTVRPAPPRRVLSKMAATKSEQRKTPTPTGRLNLHILHFRSSVPCLGLKIITALCCIYEKFYRMGRD